jgi:secreted PhoX family phosphatase
MANRDNFRNRAAAYAARFDSDGTGKWLPLVFGEQKLTPESGFKPQAEVLIDARRAADLLGATRMDRPKDVQPNGSNGKVYVILTNNDKRKDDQVDKANPRAENLFGHIIELEPRGGDHADDSFTWEILVRCGNPRDPRGGVDALWNPATSVNGWFACPDNACVDDEGRLWMATDQGDNWPRTGRADGLYGLETESDRRGTSKLFYRVPVGAELCGPCFTPGDAIRGRAAPCRGWRRGPLRFGRPSTYKNPATRWPDFREDRPPRPSVVVITKIGGGKIA